MTVSQSLSPRAFRGGTLRSPWQRLRLLGGCALVSSVCGAALFCSLRFGFGCALATSLLVAGPLAAAAAVLAFLSRQARCLAALLVLASGAKEARGALASAAVVLALTRSLSNVTRNLDILIECFECVVKASLQGIKEFVCTVKEAVDLLYAITKEITRALNDVFGGMTFSKIGDERSVGTVVTCNASLQAIEGIRNYTEGIFARLNGVADVLCHPLFNAVLVILNLLIMLILAGHYFRRYRQKLSFDNVYITNQFCSIDRELSRRGEEHVLPLLKVEREKLVILSSLALSSVERRAMVRYAVPVITNGLLCAVAIVVDYGVFLLVDVVYRHMDSIAHEHISLDMNVENNLSLIADKCFDKNRPPTPPDKGTIVKVCVLFAALALFSLSSAFINRLRRKVVSLFYPEREVQRILYLHKKILDKRRKRPRETIKLHRTLLQSIMKRGKRDTSKKLEPLGSF
ncbi:dendritic cell-specific transmembrane protein isoform X2 [Lethenteron reissneri]|uniref:dendritic cell-specific transmembrane protein isoform X2 n=1 Tax=Lethenteron reissneri TaxID=7753 RepID=UPI002AB7BBA9|nr:dendritic cell-specific transmembrane protein isoform X2 [Lethenteron reissneri]